MSDHAALREVALEAGLPGEEVDAVLASDRYADAVRADVEQAHEYGISGVPFFVLDGRFGVSGAQPADVLLQALERAWDAARDAATPEPSAVDAGGGRAGASARADTARPATARRPTPVSRSTYQSRKCATDASTSGDSGPGSYARDRMPAWLASHSAQSCSLVAVQTVVSAARSTSPSAASASTRKQTSTSVREGETGVSRVVTA